MTHSATTPAAGGEEPSVESFAINPMGEPDIIVDGHRRFVGESDFVAYRAWAKRAIAALSAPPPAAGATGVVPENKWRLGQTPLHGFKIGDTVTVAEGDTLPGVGQITDFDATGSRNYARIQFPDDTFEWVTMSRISRSAKPLAAAPEAPTPVTNTDPLIAYLERQWSWSKETFGPALRTKGIVQHITKELREIEADPHDLAEWVDVIILAMDGFWRHGGKPADLLPAMQAKQDRNFARTWPDWRTMGEDQAIEHDRSGEAPTPVTSAPGAERCGYTECAALGRTVCEDCRPLVGTSAPGADGPANWTLSQETREQLADIDKATALGPGGLEGLCVRNPAPDAAPPSVTNAKTITVGRGAAAPGAEGGEDLERLRKQRLDQIDYGVALQRIIEALCHGYDLPEDGATKAPHHHAMAVAYKAGRLTPAAPTHAPVAQGEPVAWAYEELRFHGGWTATASVPRPREGRLVRNIEPLFKQAPAAPRPADLPGREEMAQKIQKLAEHWRGANGGIYTIRAMSLEMADLFLSLLTPPSPTQEMRAAGGDGWLPIGTAPKDGQLIAVGGGCAYWDVERECWCSAVGVTHGRPIQWKLTHWKSVNPTTLPPPPAAARDEGMGGGR